MITNENFLEVSKKFIEQNVDNNSIESFLNFVAKFQEERLERLAAPTVVTNNLFAQYLSPSLNEMMENQSNKQEKFMFESTAQHYTNSILIALKRKMQQHQESLQGIDKEEFESVRATATESIEKLLNNEKKNGHKFHTVIHDYIKDSQEFLYDHAKLALRGRSMPSIQERAKDIHKTKDDKKFNMQELEHPKLEAQQFEREMKLLLKGDISENQIVSALKRVEDFQLGFIGALKKKVYNPTGSAEKLLPNISDIMQLKALKDWAWEEESVNVMNKVLKMVEKSGQNIDNTLFNKLTNTAESLESIMLDIGSFKKYNAEIKSNLLDNLNNLKKDSKQTTMKM